MIKGKTDRRKLIIPFEIYNHPNLTDGSKLFWGDVNSFKDNKDGYYQQRLTAKLRFNVSEDTITNWTNELRINELLEEYQLKFDERTAVKYRKMKTKDLSDLNVLDNIAHRIEKEDAKDDTKQKDSKKEENEIKPLGGLRGYSDLFFRKKDKNFTEQHEDDYYDEEENFDDDLNDDF